MGQPGAVGAGLSRDPAARWSALHHGIDPASVPLLRGWLRLMWLLARPLARRGVPAAALTGAGVLCAVGAALLAADVPLAALVLMLAAVLCDGLDGAVALLADRASRVGAVADAMADAVADAAFAVVLWRCGGPWPLALGAALLALGQEALRRLLGGSARSTITVHERPSRLICAAVGALFAALGSTGWPQTVAAAVWVALGVTGIGQLLGRRRATRAS